MLPLWMAVETLNIDALTLTLLKNVFMIVSVSVRDDP